MQLLSSLFLLWSTLMLQVGLVIVQRGSNSISPLVQWRRVLGGLDMGRIHGLASGF